MPNTIKTAGKNPLFVFVHDGRWDAMGVSNFKNLVITEMIKKLGGVADSTPEGTYVAKLRLEKFKPVVRLYRLETP